MEYKPSPVTDVFYVIGDSGSTYEVNIVKKSCTCPQYRIRLKGQGTCKHYQYLLRELQSLPRFQEANAQTTELLKKLKATGGIRDVEVCSLGGDADTIIQRLINEGEIYYNKKRHTYEVLE